MKIKIGKLANLRKMNTLAKKVISKREKPKSPSPKYKKKRDPESMQKMLDYLEKKETEINELPLSGPNIPQNYIKCKFYPKGACRYGKNCRYSHNFKEEMIIETPVQDSLPSLTQVGFTEVSSLEFHPQIRVSHVKTFLTRFSNGNSQLYIAIGHDCKKILIYTLNKKTPVGTFQFSELEKLLDFDILTLGSIFKYEATEDSSFPRMNTCMLTIHSNNQMRLFNVFSKKCLKTYPIDSDDFLYGNQLMYKIEKTNILKDLMANPKHKIPSQVKQRLSQLKDISTWMVINKSGVLTFIDVKKGVLLESFHIGVKINDLAFMNLDTSSKTEMSIEEKDWRSFLNNNTKTKHFLRMPKHVIVAGKGVHVWDLIQQKSLRTLSYNSYAYYLAVTGLEVQEAHGKKSLIVAMGILHDNIISLGGGVFIEIWNPLTGGCIQRITQTKLVYEYNLNHGDEYFLTVVPSNKEGEENSNGEWACLASAKNKVEVWDLFHKKKISEFDFEKENRIRLEQPTQQRFILAGYSFDNSIRVVQSTNLFSSPERIETE